MDSDPNSPTEPTKNVELTDEDRRIADSFVDNSVAEPTPAAPDDSPELDDLDEATMVYISDLMRRVTSNLQRDDQLPPEHLTRIGAITGSWKTALEDFARYQETLTAKDYRAALESGESFLNTMLPANATASTINSVNTDMLKAHAGKLTSPPDNLAMRTARRASKEPGTAVNNLAGKAAQMAVMARLRGVCKVYLLNSGFWVTIRPLQIAELYSFYQSVDAEHEEMGRVLGCAFFAFHDHHLKRTFIDLFQGAIVSSNFAGATTDRFFDALSIHDYDVCLWAMCALMFPEVTMTLRCVNTGCDYHVADQKVNLREFCLVDFSVVGAEELGTLMSKNVTLEEILAYQQQACFKGQLEYVHPDTGKLRYSLSVPSMRRFMDISETILHTALAMIQSVRSAEINETQTVLLSSIQRMMLPWVDKLTMTDETGYAEVVTDPKAIVYALDESNGEYQPSFAKDMTDFIFRTRISHIAYTASKCPKCGAAPAEELSVDGMVAVDLSTLFFVLALRRLDANRKHSIDISDN